VPELSCILLAGPNGSGKTSASAKLKLEGVWINADEIAKAMPAADDRSTDIQAGRAAIDRQAQPDRSSCTGSRASATPEDLRRFPATRSCRLKRHCRPDGRLLPRAAVNEKIVCVEGVTKPSRQDLTATEKPHDFLQLAAVFIPSDPCHE